MSFLGNWDLCGAPWTIACKEVGSLEWPPAASPSRNPSSGDIKFKGGPYLTSTAIFAIAITATVAVAVLVISLLSVLIWRKQKKRIRNGTERRSREWDPSSFGFTDLGICEEKLMDGLGSETPAAAKFNTVHSST